MRQELEAGHLPPISAECKAQTYTSLSTYTFMAWLVTARGSEETESESEPESESESELLYN
jgi:hypothetical protein